ncbi:MAG: hypothetical protein U0350_25070 [Caldilineaceae bacterium]
MLPPTQIDERQALGITLDKIEAICREVAMEAAPVTVTGYQPTPAQVFFFTLVWISKTLRKHKRAIEFKPHEAVVPCVDAPAAEARARLVAENLHIGGAAVTGLRARDGKRWELLRFQMEKAAKGFDCSPLIKEDGLHDAFAKMLDMLNKMPDGALVEAKAGEACGSLVEWVLKHQATFNGIYDFGLPIYAYAQRVVHNRLVDLLEMVRDEPLADNAWDEACVTLAVVEEPEAEEPEVYAQALKKLLNGLFALIQTKLTPMPAKAIWRTLAARSQFWLALTIAELEPPVALQPMPGASDADNAEQLGISENDLRVHRNHAKKTIYTIDPKAGELLEVFLDRHLSKRLNDWPKI